MDLRPWMIPWDPYRCSEHGQQTITIQSDGWGGEQHFCTRDAWEYGWLTGRNPWPPTREPGWRDLPENRKKSRGSSLRYFTGSTGRHRRLRLRVPLQPQRAGALG